MTAAVFDLNHHAIVAGWATYHEDRQAHPHIDAPPPEPPNGYSPSNYAKCACGWAVRSTDAIVIGEESILRHAAREARAALEEPTE